MVVFYDNGMAVGKDKNWLQKFSLQMHCNLLRVGLVLGIEKCKWDLVKLVVWNGLTFDFHRKFLCIKELRINTALTLLTLALENYLIL